MLFHSGIFIFGFLPVVLLLAAALCRLQDRRWLHLWLLASSLFFYSWWNITYLPLIIISAAVNYYIGVRLIERQEKRLLITGVALNLLLLGYFKYAGFLVLNINGITGAGLDIPEIILPLGISFFVFQKIAFLADCYTGKVTRTPSPLSFGVFVTFFPQLISGPIVHQADIMPQLTRKNLITAQTVAAGLVLFTLGLFKKVFIADNLALYTDPLFATAETRPLAMIEAWTAMLAYSFQIYFDFSGYCDMALGLAKMFGIRLPLNFFSPYKSASLIEFWRRWHITLSRFLRDYLYIPLGGNRRGEARRIGNLILTMLLGGLWHGAAWTFVFWGCLHGIYLCINHLWRKWQNAPHIPRVLAMALTFLAVSFAWIFFRATSVETALSISTALISFNGSLMPAGADSALRMLFSPQMANLAFPVLITCGVIAFFMPNTMEIMRKTRPYIGISPVAPVKTIFTWKPGLATGLIIGTLLALSLMKVLYEPSKVFLYFQF